MGAPGTGDCATGGTGSGACGRGEQPPPAARVGARHAAGWARAGDGSRWRAGATTGRVPFPRAADDDPSARGHARPTMRLRIRENK